MLAPDVVVEVESLLRGRTREIALTGERLALEVSARLGRPVHPRRCGEAVERLTANGLPVCSTSAEGYWLASSPEEYEATVAEARKRALATLKRLSAAKRNLLRLRGQRALRMEHVSAPIYRVMAQLALRVEE